MIGKSIRARTDTICQGRVALNANPKHHQSWSRQLVVVNTTFIKGA